MISFTGMRPPHEIAEDLLFLQKVVEAGKIWPFIDRRYPLAQTAEAQRYVERGHNTGNVVIAVEDSENA